jgi:hypothetical protein
MNTRRKVVFALGAGALAAPFASLARRRRNAHRCEVASVLRSFNAAIAGLPAARDDAL